MSLKWKVLLLDLCLVLALSRAPSQTRAQEAANVSPQNAAFNAAFEETLKETSKIRELSILRPVRSGIQSRSQIEQMLIRNLNEESTPEEMRASEIVLKKLGLVPADFHLREFLVKLLVEQVAGYYEPKEQQFFLADWIDIDAQKPVMAHELTHALQDQHFNLRRFEKWPKGDADAELAAHALIEGDATLAMSEYIKQNPQLAFSLLKSLLAAKQSMEQINSAPQALRDTLLFPYQQGLLWVSQLYRRGGWSLVSQAYSDLPASTKQIMHPEAYFEHESPVKVEQYDISSKLGLGWKRIDYDVNGEWGYYLALNQYLKPEEDAGKIVKAWAGDRYALYENGRSGETLLVQLSAWKTEKDAAAFFGAYTTRTFRRYPGATVTKVADTCGLGASSMYWRTLKEGVMAMEREGSRVAILEGIPQGANPKNLMKDIWSQ